MSLLSRPGPRQHSRVETSEPAAGGAQGPLSPGCHVGGPRCSTRSTFPQAQARQECARPHAASWRRAGGGGVWKPRTLRTGARPAAGRLEAWNPGIRGSHIHNRYTKSPRLRISGKIQYFCLKSSLSPLVGVVMAPALSLLGPGTRWRREVRGHWPA